MGNYKGISNYTDDSKNNKFNNFINKTIILSSKRYFKKESNISNKEKMVINDEKSSLSIQRLIEPNSFYDAIESKIELNNAINSLSAIEQAVVFLLFEKELSQEEASKILEICSKSVSRIKIRAINKMRKFFEEDC